MSTRPTRQRRYAPGHMLLPAQRANSAILMAVCAAVDEHLRRAA